METIHMRIRILEAYAIVSSLTFGALIVGASSQSRKKFEEIDVERLNVIEKNGQLRVVIANGDRMPDPVIDGKSFKTERAPGLVFYNGLGDENGGLIFGAVTKDGKYGAYGGLSFDQYKQAQSIAILYNDHDGSREAGLRVWDRPETPLSELIAERAAMEKIQDGPEKSLLKARLQEAEFSPTRVFVGKNKEKEAKVALYDAKGKVRINMEVGAQGKPKLEFLDENGKVTYRLPPIASDPR